MDELLERMWQAVRVLEDLAKIQNDADEGSRLLNKVEGLRLAISYTTEAKHHG